MKTVFIVLSILIVAFIVLLFNFRAISKAGEASGLVEGMLSKCPNKPNCVCSEQKDDAKHYIDPIIIPNYLAATFTSAIFRFVDDLEIRIDSTQKVIHIRSASRVGYSDMGVNKKRTELLKKLFNYKVSEANKSLKATPKSGAH